MKSAKLSLCAAALMLGSVTAANALASGWAVVSSNGTLIRGEGTLGVSHPGDGTYVVQFKHKVKACVFTATIGDGTATSPPPGYVTVAGANGSTDSVYVATYGADGAAADIGYHLNVRC